MAYLRRTAADGRLPFCCSGVFAAARHRVAGTRCRRWRLRRTRKRYGQEKQLTHEKIRTRQATDPCLFVVPQGYGAVAGAHAGAPARRRRRQGGCRGVSPRLGVRLGVASGARLARLTARHGRRRPVQRCLYCNSAQVLSMRCRAA